MDSNNQKTINELMTAFRGLQQRLLQEVVNSHVETEMTLKQLVAYLNVSSQNLSEVHSIVNQFNTAIEALKNQIERQNNTIGNIENKVIELPQETYKIKDLLSQNSKLQSETIDKYLAQNVEYLKKMYQVMSQQNTRIQNLETSLSTVIKTIESDLDKNHENLTGIINTLIGNKATIDSKKIDIDAKKIDAKTTGKEQETKKLDVKLTFWAKVIAIVLGSGGVIYMIIEAVLKFIRK